MNRHPSRMLFLVVLFVALTLDLSAPPVAHAHSKTTHSTPVFGEWFENVNIGRPSDRRTVVRIAALGMALALFIMFRSKH